MTGKWWMVICLVRSTNTPIQPPSSSSVFQVLYIKIESCKLPPKPVRFHPARPHMGPWSATRPESFGCHFIPPALHGCLSMIRYLVLHGPPWSCRAKSYIVQMNTHRNMHIHIQSSTFTTWAGLWAQGWWWWWWWAGGGGLGADTFLLTITSHTGTHIPTSWWPPPILFPWATVALLPQQVLLELCRHGADLGGQVYRA